LLIKVVEEKLENGIKLIDHFCYATEVNGIVFRRRVVVALAATLRRQIREIVDTILRFVIALAQLFLPYNSVEWVEVK
jgi:hypothetical protein